MSSSAAGPCNICGCTDFAQVCHTQESSVLVVCMATHARMAMSTMHVDSDLTQSWLARASASRMHRSSRITWPGCAYGYVVAICHSLWPESRPVATTRLHAALLCTTHTCVHVSSLAVGMRDAVIRSVRMSFHIGQACMLLHGD